MARSGQESGVREIRLRRSGGNCIALAAQAPERSAETRGKCPEKATSRSGHALVASWSCTGSCGLSMTTSTPESADDFDQVHLQPHTRLPVSLLRPQGNKPPEFSVPIPS